MADGKVAERQAPGTRHRIVHLRAADYPDEAARARWQRLGYATLPPMEGHDPYAECRVCTCAPGCGEFLEEVPAREVSRG